jgi:hypothetical protein
VRNGKPHAVPMGPLSAITTPLWSFAAKLRVLKEPFVRPAPPGRRRKCRRIRAAPARR